ncbi:hypothetical protein [Paraburkholderia strydomiana]|jgi:hypothetical protein|uniref:hypothetical protein n=1 Tax=Paraburkholderia strydomiana TaxID=1245417 RepID=UPI0038B7C05E
MFAIPDHQPLDLSSAQRKAVRCLTWLQTPLANGLYNLHRSNAVIDMVIVPDAFMADAPQGMLATSLNPQLRHFNFAEIRHLNFGPTVDVEARFKCRGAG